MGDPLAHIKRPVAQELDTFEDHFRAALKSHIPLLDKIMYYVIRRKGKRVRPMFVFLSARISGEINATTYRAASLIELLHTATLVHDDVVDDSYERRGVFSINALWKNKIAVLVGDYLLSRGLLLALDNEDYKVLQIMSRSVKEMSEGELLQIEKTRKLDITEEVYFDIIRQKTASLIAASCAAGAASVTSDPDIIETMRRVGEKAGLAFQIKDDLLDYGDVDIGKPLAIDIKEKKITLPLIYALKHADPRKRRKIIRTIKYNSSDKKMVGDLIAYVHACGGVRHAEEAMMRLRDEAVALTRTLPESEGRSSLEELILYVTDRKK
jgi:octaprenyl-diphosphate synthase